jgi:hypothetical protein
MVGPAGRDDDLRAGADERADGLQAESRVAPVTIASLPLRSIPASTSAAVERAPKPDPMGCWGVKLVMAPR